MDNDETECMQNFRGEILCPKNVIRGILDLDLVFYVSSVNQYTIALVERKLRLRPHKLQCKHRAEVRSMMKSTVCSPTLLNQLRQLKFTFTIHLRLVPSAAFSARRRCCSWWPALWLVQPPDTPPADTPACPPLVSPGAGLSRALYTACSM